MAFFPTLFTNQVVLDMYHSSAISFLNDFRYLKSRMTNDNGLLIIIIQFSAGKWHQHFSHNIYSKFTKAVQKFQAVSIFTKKKKKGSKSVISIFCCSVLVGNINLYFQTFLLQLIVIIQWCCCMQSDNSQCSTQRSDHHPVCLRLHEETEQTETVTKLTHRPSKLVGN